MYALEQAENGKAQIWTSALTLAEVWKKKCEGKNARLQENRDRAFEDYIEKDFIIKASVDADVGTLARKLLRKHPGLRKPNDAIHVATCLLNNIDELHTFDGKHLLGLDDRLPRSDQKRLSICQPPEPPADPQGELDLETDKTKDDGSD